ncbi:hypothetical protein O3M35_003509 [Rhynocoris fuscipes]|uniref:Pacifastin domain-containing protein n=1 Tax=Rhynocoris fuscipes TaxID=488301 RepID=A0AAW1CKW4_9HEMI
MNIFITLTLLTTIAHYSLAAPGERIQKKTCKPGSTWKEECHSCYCTEDRKIACSKEACPPQLVPRNRRAISRQDCKEGESWKEDCHTCFCSWGRPACTRELCPSEAGDFKVVLPGDDEPTTEAPCEEGKIWKEDCHTCHCTHGKPACTRELCPSEAIHQVTVDDNVTRTKREEESVESEEEDEKCPPNVKEWKEDCNDCYCGDDGLKVCTKLLCPDQGPKVAIQPKE